jgi:hypothetical protein
MCWVGMNIFAHSLDCVWWIFGSQGEHLYLSIFDIFFDIELFILIIDKSSYVFSSEDVICLLERKRSPKKY